MGDHHVKSDFHGPSYHFDLGDVFGNDDELRRALEEIVDQARSDSRDVSEAKFSDFVKESLSNDFSAVQRVLGSVTEGYSQRELKIQAEAKAYAIKREADANAEVMEAQAELAKAEAEFKRAHAEALREHTAVEVEAARTKHQLEILEQLRERGIEWTASVDRRGRLRFKVTKQAAHDPPKKG